MLFNNHSALEGQHAFLSPSNYHWINYNDQKLRARWSTKRASARGVAMHAYADMAIKLGIKQSRTKKTLNMYINDGIQYKMKCEQLLYYSDNSFGTADAISYSKGVLRIHDLKTGLTKTSFMQLKVYAALFCLEYSVNPEEIVIELRIYQNDEVSVEVAVAEDIAYIMDRIVELDIAIESLKDEEGSP